MPHQSKSLQTAKSVGEIAALLFIIFGMCCEGSFVIDISYILKNFLDMICRYAYVFWYVKLSFLTYRFPDRPARSNSASWRVCWRGGGFGSGTTCLGFSLRHQSRRGKNKEPLCHCVPLCAIDMQQASNQSVKHLSTC